MPWPKAGVLTVLLHLQVISCCRCSPNEWRQADQADKWSLALLLPLGLAHPIVSWTGRIVTTSLKSPSGLSPLPADITDFLAREMPIAPGTREDELFRIAAAKPLKQFERR